MAVLGRATLELNADSARLEQDLGRAVQQAAAFGTAVGTVMGQAVSAGINKLTSMVHTAIETGDELNKLSQKTGMSVGSLSELRVAAQLADVSMQTLKTSVTGLYEQLSRAGRVDGKSRTAFEAIGLDIEKLRALNPDELFRTITERLAMYQDGANRSAIQTAIFGASGKELSPLINELGKTTALARELGITMNSETAAAAERFKDNLTISRIATEALGMRIAQVLLPSLEKLSGYLVDNAKNTERLDTVSRAADAGLKIIATGAALVGTAFEIVGGQIGRMAAVFGAVANGDFKAAASLVKDTFTDVGTALGETAGKIHMVWEETGNKVAAGAEANGQKLAAPAIEAVKKIKAARREADQEFQAFLKIKAIEDEAAAEAQKFYGQEGAAKEAARAKEIADRELMMKQVYEFEEAEAEAAAKAERIAAGVEGVGSKLKETNDFARDMGLTFSSAFEKAVAGGEKLSSVLKGLAKDILGIAMRKLVTEPLGNGIAGMFGGGGGSGLSSLLSLGSSFFGGGSSSVLGSMYSGGGAIADGWMLGGSFASGTDYVPRDMIARIHEGEAIVPADENRNGGARSVNVNFHVNTLDGRQAAAVLVENKEVITGIIRGAAARNGRSTPF